MNKTDVDFQEFCLKLPSIQEEVNKVEPLVDGLREKLDISDETVANMLISLSEAVNNAIVHGNKQNPELIVDIDVSFESNMLCIKVTDRGPGFDYNNLPDPTAPENLEKLTGRGIFLIQQLTDMVVFSDNGAIVEMYFKL